MKILIIGQAPPAVKQLLPYDTTLLYEMLSWVGIDKNKAQELFEFEAMTDKFPGKTNNGHAKPSVIEMNHHYHFVLKQKIEDCKGVLILGNVPKEALQRFGAYVRYSDKPMVKMIHPSRRNYSKIMAQKENIISQFNLLINQ